jgi:hypothetical protein
MARVLVYRAFWKSELRSVGLSEQQVLRLCPEAAGPGWSIRATEEDVPDARGVVIDWNRHGGSARGPKVHWHCPCCGGQEHWSDFEYADTNPVLWFCWEEGDRVCLVHWVDELAAEPDGASDSGRDAR